MTDLRRRLLSLANQRGYGAVAEAVLKDGRYRFVPDMEVEDLLLAFIETPVRKPVVEPAYVVSQRDKASVLKAVLHALPKEEAKLPCLPVTLLSLQEMGLDFMSEDGILVVPIFVQLHKIARLRKQFAL